MLALVSEQMGPLPSYELYLAHLVGRTPVTPGHIARVHYCWLTKTDFTKLFVHRHNSALRRCTLRVAELQPIRRTPITHNGSNRASQEVHARQRDASVLWR